MNEQDKKRFDNCLELTRQAIEEDCARVPLGHHPKFWAVTEASPKLFYGTSAALLLAILVTCYIFA